MNNGYPSDKNHITDSSPAELPYLENRGDWGAWIYDHRRGIAITVAVYLLTAIFFVTAKIVTYKNDAAERFFVNIEEMPREAVSQPEKTREEQMMEQLNRESFSDVRNLVSNSDSKLNAGLRDDKGTNASNIYDEANAAQDRLRSSREAYEKGLKDTEDILRSRNTPQSGASQATGEDSRQKGRVTVSYSLEGRRAVYLHIPAYQCEGGGEIAVSITVNRNGTVIAATPATGSSSNSCLNEMAVKAALSSRFNVDGNAPDRQQGTITYMFISQ